MSERMSAERREEIRNEIRLATSRLAPVLVSPFLADDLLTELDAVTRELDAEKARLDWLDEDGLGTNYLRLRAGRNRIGIATGGWLLTHGRIGEGSESKHFSIREAIDAAMGKAVAHA